VLTPAQKYEIGKRTAEIGTMATIRNYAKHYPDLSLKETLVRRFKDKYQDKVKKSIHSSTFAESLLAVKELVPKKRGTVGHY